MLHCIDQSSAVGCRVNKKHFIDETTEVDVAQSPLNASVETSTAVPENTMHQALLIANKCTLAFEMFTQSVINYTRCTLDHARPVRVCTQCGVAHLIFEGTYENLKKHQEDCESFLGSFQMEIFDMMYKRGKEMWDTLNCQNCYDYPFETVRFLKASSTFLDCIRIPETVEIISMRSLCKRCPTEFKNMSSMYKRFVHRKKSSVGAICMDIVDRMNYTHSLYSLYNCVDPFGDSLEFWNYLTAVGILGFTLPGYLMSRFTHHLAHIKFTRCGKLVTRFTKRTTRSIEQLKKKGYHVITVTKSELFGMRNH
ncbi:osteopetrosis-associated transmembrane protein 1 [Caerostris darwini]|uniref:Osteopetrosis-associated transmembrane protein 1 n=1 Tax=Caerostris darwini TaxID=1538125 RepID=A0AAV4UKM3_9ARAC|nr:osteopetrosis-associated transmembrane protein 1 [Caerostris darwini]